MECIENVNDILERNIIIPDYQRPYKWSSRNVIEALEDIYKAIGEEERYNDGKYKYRFGTVILFDNKNGEFEIVDGQQRMMTLAILNYYLNSSFSCSLLDASINSKESYYCIKNNFNVINDWFNGKDSNIKEKFIYALNNILETVVLIVDKLTHSFQLFDSQNTRGKALDPHDLLKAYHLREMRNEPYEMFHAVEKWEMFEPEEIRKLFEIYLFPILNWSRKEKTPIFSAKYIDYYKGIGENSDYTYAKRAKKAEPYYQISEPFIAGNDFFEMTSHYLRLLNDLENEINVNPSFSKLKDIINEWKKNGKEEYKSTGFKYSVELFKGAVLCYYDKFHNFEVQAIKKIFVWAFMLRVDMINLGYDSVNKYASGDFIDKYTNKVPMFALIINSRNHQTISNLLIKVDREGNVASDSKWNNLYYSLRELSGKKD